MEQVDCLVVLVLDLVYEEPIGCWGKEEEEDVDVVVEEFGGSIDCYYEDVESSHHSGELPSFYCYEDFENWCHCW